MAYFVEEKLNRAGHVIGLSQIQYTKNKVPAGKISIDMNGIKFKDYQESPKDYYLSGNKLIKIARESDTNE